MTLRFVLFSALMCCASLALAQSRAVPPPAAPRQTATPSAPAPAAAPQPTTPTAPQATTIGPPTPITAPQATTIGRRHRYHQGRGGR